MKGLFIRFVITGVAVLLATQIIPGIEAQSLVAGIAAVLVLALLNAIVRPLLYFLSLPFIILTLGLFMVIINALLLQLVAFLVKGFVVDGFWPAVWGSLVISVVGNILNVLVSEEGRVEVVVHRPKPPPRIINPD